MIAPARQARCREPHPPPKLRMTFDPIRSYFFLPYIGHHRRRGGDVGVHETDPARAGRTDYELPWFPARSMSRISEVSRMRSKIMRRPSDEMSKVRMTEGSASRVRRRERIVARSSSQKSWAFNVSPRM